MNTVLKLRISVNAEKIYNSWPTIIVTSGSVLHAVGCCFSAYKKPDKRLSTCPANEGQ